MSTQTQEFTEEYLATLTDEERAAVSDSEYSPEELAAMQGIIKEDGEPPAEEEDSDTAPGSPAEAPAAKDDKPAEPKPTEEPAAKADETEDTAPASKVSRYDAKLPDDYNDQVAAMATQEAELKQKFKDGDIDFDQMEEQRSGITKQRDDLLIARAKAEISTDMNAQSAVSAWESSVDTFVASEAKREGGIDYKNDAEKSADLDQFVKVLAQNQANADKSFEWFLSEAHKRVKALHGIAEKKPVTVDPDAVKKAAADKRKQDPASIPANLSQVPGADGPGDIDGEFSALDNLEGEKLEAAIAKMTPEQRERYASA